MSRLTSQLLGDRRPVAIRPASVRDVREIALIWRDGQLSQGDQPLDLDEAINVFRKRVESATDVYGVWVAEIEGLLIGWQSLHPCRSNPIHKWAESSTYIAKESKGRGVGRALLTFATEHAKSARLSFVVGFIKAGNDPPIKIVESLGWRRVGSIPRANADDIEWLYYVYAVPRELNEDSD
jgi:L-amino acid N-acyltransferase YncA